tara:strand:+ start:220 stop:522 length:303 start_codon:yes stop_codon:yes gene_type:complete
MWEDILKRAGAKRLNYSFLKQVTLGLANKFKGKTLNRDEFQDFLEQIRQVYSVKHKSISVDRIRNIIVTILKRNDLLEVKVKLLGPEEFHREERIYIFKE